MNIIENQTFDNERALYGSFNLTVNKCNFDGKADGESAFKECKNISVNDCYFNLRYPFWHDDGLTMTNCELTQNCRAALWYSSNVSASNTKFHGIKAFRECKDIKLENCDVISPEFGWSIDGVTIDNCSIDSEYFMMRSNSLNCSNMNMKGKYSFQYISDSLFDNCSFDTKDAFWHGKNITVKNCTIKGEYLAWYSEGLTLINCKIIGTQPFCYCKNLTLIDCEMIGCDLAFEKSEVNATILNTVDSIKNPLSGKIKVNGVNEIIIDDANAKAQIIITK